LIDRFFVFNATFSNISAISWRPILVIVFNATFSNISAISWRPVLVVSSETPQLQAVMYWFFLIFGAVTFNISWRPVLVVEEAGVQYFSYIMATSFSGGRSRRTRREPQTMGKQMVNFITCCCESSAPFLVIYQIGREPTPYWW